MRYLILIAVFILCFTRFKNSKKLFQVSMFLYAIFLGLRCGQGLDYFSYSYAYNRAQYSLSEMLFEGAQVTAVNFETGYNILVGIFKQFGASYEVFIATLSTAMVILLYRFIMRYSKNYMLSFFVLYASYGIVLIESALRQGIATILLVTLAMPLLQEKKYIKACITMFIAYFFHASSIAFIIMLLLFYIDPIYDFIIKNRVKLLLVFAIPSIFIFNIIEFPTLLDMLHVPDTWAVRAERYFSGESNYSVTAIGYRAVMLVASLLALKFCDTDKETRKKLYLLICGYIIYFAIAQVPLLSRLTIYFEFIEIVVIPALVGGKWHYKSYSSASHKRLIGIVTATYMSILSVLFMSEMNFTMQRDSYNTPYVPYISIFQQDDLDIIFEKSDSRYFELYWDYYQQNTD